MKKILIAALAASVMTASAMAAPLIGKISQLTVKSDGTVAVYLTLTADSSVKSGVFHGTADAKKVMIATAMSAKVANTDVRMIFTQEAGKWGWGLIEMR